MLGLGYSTPFVVIIQSGEGNPCDHGNRRVEHCSSALVLLSERCQGLHRFGWTENSGVWLDGRVQAHGRDVYGIGKCSTGK